MGLADRLAKEPARRGNRGCTTCEWVTRLSDKDRKAMNEWLSSGRSRRQFYWVAAALDDDPIPVSESSFKNHMLHHHNRFGDDT